MWILLFLGVASLLSGKVQDPAVLSNQAQELAGEKRGVEAEELWKEAIRLSPGYFPALFNLGFFYFQEQKMAEAEPLLRHAAEVSGHDFNAYYMLGLTCRNLDKQDDALRAWRLALRIQPDNLRLMQVMSVEYSRGRYFAEAAELAKRALVEKSDDANLYFLAIKAYQDAGDDQAAGEVAKQAAEKFPESARANFEYAFHLQREGKLAEAMVRLKTAMKTDPTYEEPFFLYGNLLVDQGLNEEAIPYLRSAIKNRNDFVPARVVLARAMMNSENWDEAIAELKETIKLDAKHPQPHLLLSQIYFRRGDEARAKSEKEISMQLRRANPAVLEALQARPFPKN